ncbi:FkbM family methyltransferase [Roseomonas sp. BN140053]|uniref:FkbM family methyltransferase n=1 Tax=Roseomonas sp. BN140053 TaxID=3391898 RepID=UPI0039EAFCC1
MTFISYAQNFEDVLLRRVFRDVEEGFYVDVGAFDPALHSVTKGFYDAGWTGLNIEPGPSFDAFPEARPRDTNLRLALAEQAGRARFLVDRSRSSGEILGTSRLHAPEDVAPADVAIEECEVEVSTLAAVLDAHAAGRHIHFLKIDAEGAEGRILRGADWTRHRPEVLVIEATRPGTQERVDAEWSGLLSAARYRAVYFDGLNAWFLREESAARAAAFGLPVNVFDDFHVAPAETATLLASLDQWGHGLEAQLLAARDELAGAAERARAAEAELPALREELARTQARVQAADSWGHSLEAQLLASREAVAQVEARAEAADAWGHSLEAQLLAVREELAQAGPRAQAAEQRGEALEAELRTARDRLAQAEAREAAAAEWKLSLEAGLLAARDEAAALGEQARVAREWGEALEAQLRAARDRAARAEESLERSYAAFDEERKQGEEAAAEAATLRQQFTASEAWAWSLNAAVLSKEEAITALRAELEALQQENANRLLPRSLRAVGGLLGRGPAAAEPSPAAGAAAAPAAAEAAPAAALPAVPPARLVTRVPRRLRRAADRVTLSAFYRLAFPLVHAAARRRPELAPELAAPPSPAVPEAVAAMPEAPWPATAPAGADPGPPPTLDKHLSRSLEAALLTLAIRREGPEHG